MSSRFKLSIAIMIAFVLFIGLYFFDNIKGYYHFTQYCKNEGGLKIYEKLEKGLGMMDDDNSNPLSLCNGQLKLASSLEVFKNNSSAAIGDKPPLFW